MSSDMAAEMGHGGNMDLPTMVRDMRNRFWICLVFAVPIFIYSPMGGMFTPPAPPFGLQRNHYREPLPLLHLSLRPDLKLRRRSRRECLWQRRRSPTPTPSLLA